MKKFKPAKGQTDYTKIHWCPVINCVLEFKGKILIVQRNKNLNFYPGYWNGISGFLDDSKPIREKIKGEIAEELNLSPRYIRSIKMGRIFHQKAPKYNKTWIVHPVLVKISSNQIKIDWEAQDFRWISIQEASKYKLLPGFKGVLREIQELL